MKVCVCCSHEMDLVKIHLSSDLSTDEMRLKFPESTKLLIKLKDGRLYSGFCGNALGMPIGHFHTKY